MGDPSNWSANEVATQLRGAGLGQYRAQFINNNVDGRKLFQLTENNLHDFGLPVQQRIIFKNWKETLPKPSNRPAPARGAAIALPPQRKAPGPQQAPRQPRTYNRYGKPEPEFDIHELDFTPPARVTTIPKTRKLGRPHAPPVPETGSSDDRVACRFCSRKFASDRISTHESACAGANKKRRVFNSQRQRLSGTEAASYQRRSTKTVEHKQQMIGGKPKFVVEHENLVASLRAARRMQAYEEGKIKAPPKMPVIQDLPDDRVLCPYCGRKFGEIQFERHVKSCSATMPIDRARPYESRGRVNRPAAATRTSTASRPTGISRTSAAPAPTRSTRGGVTKKVGGTSGRRLY